MELETHLFRQPYCEDRTVTANVISEGTVARFAIHSNGQFGSLQSDQAAVHNQYTKLDQP
ncbi:hypothetical protein SP21_94 [Salmonella phage 21]|nr:hypothetical protein SP21_94 [Salmonella phage 21]